MYSIRVTWEDDAVASSFHGCAVSAPPELAPASDSSSSTFQSDYSAVRVSATDANDDVHKEEDLTEWASDGCDLPARRCVSFKDVEIKQYAIIPGIHPDCCVGPPLSIDWEPVKVSSYSVDEFETRRKGNRKSAIDLRLGWWNRRCLLRRLGFSDNDMKEAEKSSQWAKKQRDITSARMKLSKVEEVQQKVMRKLGRAFHPKVTLQTKY